MAEATARKVAKATRTYWNCGKARHTAASCSKGGNKNLYAIGEDESEVNEQATSNDDELQAWCLLEERDHEQLQEVMSRRGKTKTEESCECVTAECGKRKKFVPQENK